MICGHWRYVRAAARQRAVHTLHNNQLVVMALQPGGGTDTDAQAHSSSSSSSSSMTQHSVHQLNHGDAHVTHQLRVVALHSIKGI
jgi:hypothetical protein